MKIGLWRRCASRCGKSMQYEKKKIQGEYMRVQRWRSFLRLWINVMLGLHDSNMSVKHFPVWSMRSYLWNRNQLLPVGARSSRASLGTQVSRRSYSKKVCHKMLSFPPPHNPDARSATLCSSSSWSQPTTQQGTQTQPKDIARTKVAAQESLSRHSLSSSTTHPRSAIRSRWQG